MKREPGMSARLKLTLSYAAVVLLTGGLLLVIVWLFLLRYVPAEAIATPAGFVPGREDLVRAFVPPAAGAFFVLLVVGLGGGWLLAGRMLAPLTRITAATRRVAQGSLSHRIELEGPADEFRELADGFDAMLARVEAQVAEQQRFAANASHELRTPLAITQVLLDVARSDPGRDPAELVERLRTVNARAIDLTEALLLLSRAEQHPSARESVDLSLLAEEAAETLLPLAEARGVAVEVAGEPALVVGSPALLAPLVANLLTNAIVHNAPEGGWARVTVSAEAHGVEMAVENSGEVLDPSLVVTLTEPFRRGTDRVRGDHAGVGLGLAIVASIVRAHGGTLALDPLPAGGLRVVVRLPAAPAG